MRSVKARFTKQYKPEDGVTTYIAFLRAIKGQNFSKKTIRDNFEALVDREDYSLSDKEELLEFLYRQ